MGAYRVGDHMFRIIDNNISLTRADSGVINVVLESQNGQQYQKGSGDVITFIVKNGDTVLFERKIKADMITIVPECTASLNYGNYTWEIVILHMDGTTDTTGVGGKFTITNEVTF